MESIKCLFRFLQHHWLIMPKPHTLPDTEENIYVGITKWFVSSMTTEPNNWQMWLTITVIIPTSAGSRWCKTSPARGLISNLPTSAICSGYHSRRWLILGKTQHPDIFSDHHLYLRDIVNPWLVCWLLKYPTWPLLVWISNWNVWVIWQAQQLIKTASPSMQSLCLQE